MKRTMLILTALLVACEGEPPKVPQGGAGATSGASEAPAAEAKDDGQPAEANEPTTRAPAPESAPTGNGCNCGCCCNGPGGADGGTPAAAATGDGGAAAVAAMPVAPPPVANGNVVGHVTTMPANASGNAVVFFEDGPVEPPAKKVPVIDNHMMNFIPFVQVVQADGRVLFRNSDPFPHNVFSPDGKGFNVGIISQNSSATRVFKTPGEYSLLCNLHPGMLGYLVVTPNGHYAHTNASGQYAIKDIPPGTYKVTAWAPRQKPVTQSVTVPGGGDVTLDFELHR
jgi:plastocyanin